MQRREGEEGGEEESQALNQVRAAGLVVHLEEEIFLVGGGRKEKKKGKRTHFDGSKKSGLRSRLYCSELEWRRRFVVRFIRNLEL